MIWWLQIIAAVEVKRLDTGWDEHIKQLMGYLRRILREQLDRRFVFGLTLGPTTMTVWMHDRSGVMGTKAAIDIHEVGHGYSSGTLIFIRYSRNRPNSCR
jgi:hypothetical protein